MGHEPQREPGLLLARRGLGQVIALVSIAGPAAQLERLDGCDAAALRVAAAHHRNIQLDAARGVDDADRHVVLVLQLCMPTAGTAAGSKGLDCSFVNALLGCCQLLLQLLLRWPLLHIPPLQLREKFLPGLVCFQGGILQHRRVLQWFVCVPTLQRGGGGGGYLPDGSWGQPLALGGLCPPNFPPQALTPPPPVQLGAAGAEHCSLPACPCCAWWRPQ